MITSASRTAHIPQFVLTISHFEPKAAPNKTTSSTSTTASLPQSVSGPLMGSQNNNSAA